MGMSFRQPSMDVDGMLKEYHATRNPALRDQIVERHLYIAAIIAKRFSGRGVDYDDLYQVASMALLKALERFEPDRGIKFASFVTPSMIGEVKNYFRDRSRTIRLPRRASELIRLVEQAREALSVELNRQPTVEELADRLEISVEDILESLEMRAAASPVSLDTMPSEDDETAPLSTYLGAEETGYREFERNDMLARAMRNLDERQQEIIRLRYFENMGQREVAERIGVSQMTVSRAERRALELLRDVMHQPQDD